MGFFLSCPPDDLPPCHPPGQPWTTVGLESTGPTDGGWLGRARTSSFQQASKGLSLGFRPAPPLLMLPQTKAFLRPAQWPRLSLPAPTPDMSRAC